jgi:hypothetical protein
VKKLLYLINFEFTNSIKKVLLLCLAMAVTQNLSLMILGSRQAYAYLRFENVLSISMYSQIFYLFFAALLGLQFYIFHKDYSGGKGIYTSMTLPTKRSYIFISKYVSALCSFLILVLFQIINVFITYGLYLSNYYYTPKVRNGLYMAFIRDEFLNSFFPQHPIGFAIGFFILISTATFSLSLVISIKSKKYISLFFSSIFLWSSLGGILETINNSGQDYRHGRNFYALDTMPWTFSLVILLVIAFIMNILMIKKSVKQIEKNEIL